MIRWRDARRSEWLPSRVGPGIWRWRGLSESMLRHPGGPLSVREPLGAEPLPPMVDAERAIEKGVDIDPRASVAASPRAGMDLEEGPVEGHRVVVRNGAPVFEAADACEVKGRRPPGGLRRGRGVGEAPVKARSEAVKGALGLGEGARLGEAEFHDEAILKGAKEPFYAASA